jgi:putative Mn2+ efflux pump MntP
MGTILLLGVLAGVDNLQVCSMIGLLPIRRARKHLLGMMFAGCEIISPVIGLALGKLVHSALGSAAAMAGPVVLLLCGVTIFVLALREKDVTELVNERAVLFGLPFSLSLDNLLAGVGLGVVHYPVLLSAVVIGLISATMSCIGLYLGGWLRRFVPKRTEIVVGAYLCALALRLIFSEHA